MPEAHIAVNSEPIISRSTCDQLTNKLGRKGLQRGAEQGAHFFFGAGSDGRLLSTIELGCPAGGQACFAIASDPIRRL
jgi:hypothetical protein